MSPLVELWSEWRRWLEARKQLKAEAAELYDLLEHSPQPLDWLMRERRIAPNAFKLAVTTWWRKGYVYQMEESPAGVMYEQRASRWFELTVKGERVLRRKYAPWQ